MIHINHNFQEINATISSLIGIYLIIIVHKLILLIFLTFSHIIRLKRAYLIINSCITSIP